MSTKDERYYRRCPICKDTLIGTDDGLEVFESLKSQIEDMICNNEFIPNCTLCGESCKSLEEAQNILLLGEPKLEETHK
jgi:hypothetical protein